jgi:hypothetical protein
MGKTRGPACDSFGDPKKPGPPASQHAPGGWPAGKVGRQGCMVSPIEYSLHNDTPPSPFRCGRAALEHTFHNTPTGVGGKNDARQPQRSVPAVPHD